MDFNRNHYFIIGVVLLLLGLQFRLVDRYVLNESASQFLTTQLGLSSDTPRAKAAGFFPSVGRSPPKIVEPPQWLGWALMSVGSVLILHSLAMKRPGA